MTSSNGNIFRVTGHLCGEFNGHRWIPGQRPVTRSFDVFFDLRLNNRLSKQSWGWWFETLSRPLWRNRNGIHYIVKLDHTRCYHSVLALRKQFYIYLSVKIHQLQILIFHVVRLVKKGASAVELSFFICIIYSFTVIRSQFVVVAKASVACYSHKEILAYTIFLCFESQAHCSLRLQLDTLQI